MQRGQDCLQNRLARTSSVGLISKRVLGATPGHLPASHHLSRTPPPIPKDRRGFCRLAEVVPSSLRVFSRTSAFTQTAFLFWNNWPYAGFHAPMLEFVIFKRRRNFCWQVRDKNGKMVATGREKTRSAARYHAYRALFLLLSTSWRATDLQPS